MQLSMFPCLQTLHTELQAGQLQLDELQDKLQSLDEQYSSPDTQSLNKDLTILVKKYTTVLQKADKVGLLYVFILNRVWTFISLYLQCLSLESCSDCLST